MKWYGNLYLGSGLEGKKEKLIKKLETNAGLHGVYLLTLAAAERDLFDVFSADVMLQPVMHSLCPMIVGLAKSKQDALDIAIDIINKTYEETGGFDVKQYLLSHVQQDVEAVVEYPMNRLKPRRRLFFEKK